MSIPVYFICKLLHFFICSTCSIFSFHSTGNFINIIMLPCLTIPICPPLLQAVKWILNTKLFRYFLTIVSQQCLSNVICIYHLLCPLILFLAAERCLSEYFYAYTKIYPALCLHYMQQSQEMCLVFGAEISNICTEFHSPKKAWSPVQMKKFYFCEKPHYSYGV